VLENNDKNVDDTGKAAVSMPELEILYEIARTFDKHVDLKGGLSQLLSILGARAGLNWGMVTLLHRESGELKIEEADGLTGEEKSSGIYRLGEGLVGKVFETGEALVVRDLSLERRFVNRAKNRSAEDLRGKTFYCVPIISAGSVIGTLSAEARIHDTDGVRLRDKIYHDMVQSIEKYHLTLLKNSSEIISDSTKLRERILEEFFPNNDISFAGKGNELHVVNDGNIVNNIINSGSKIVGTSSAMRELFLSIKQVAPSDATVLILGESGTGKELAAVEIERLSKRSGGAFIKINCAALPESIIESTLFGHEKGAFTGALSRHIGKFESAENGTLFLDEVGELPPQIQVKLLRVLQEREIERIGGNSPIKVNVRLIAASNRDLASDVEAGRFRDDLYYRLNVFPIVMPPLRNRKSDIMLLSDYFAEDFARKNNKPIKRISQAAIDLLASYNWPGNVRELQNCIERAVILSLDGVIHSYHLGPSLQSASSTNTQNPSTLEAALSRLEKDMIIDALKTSGGNTKAAATQLGISERQMGLRLHHYAINWRYYRNTRME
jgi:Nif-specific regulatory protein